MGKASTEPGEWGSHELLRSKSQWCGPSPVLSLFRSLTPSLTRKAVLWLEEPWRGLACASDPNSPSASLQTLWQVQQGDSECGDLLTVPCSNLQGPIRETHFWAFSHTQRTFFGAGVLGLWTLGPLSGAAVVLVADHPLEDAGGSCEPEIICRDTAARLGPLQ